MPIKSRIAVFRQVFNRPAKIVLGIFALLGLYDTLVSQLLPDDMVAKMPRAWKFISMTTGYLSWQSWLLIAEGLVILILFEYVCRRFDSAKREFEEEFGNIDNHSARKDFRWNLEQASRSFFDSDSIKLKDLINRFEFPRDFPPTAKEGIASYARRFQPRELDEQLWLFFKEVFRLAVEQPNKDGPLLDREGYERLYEGRRITAKFWDRWARKINEGKALREDIGFSDISNQRDVMALALSELAMSYHFQWDDGPGKKDLFMLAVWPDLLGTREGRKRRKEILMKREPEIGGAA